MEERGGARKGDKREREERVGGRGRREERVKGRGKEGGKGGRER